MSDETTKEPKAKKEGVGFTATNSILAGMTNEDAFKAVQAAHPEAKTTMASINWYRNKLRQDGTKCADGSDVKTSRELRAASKPPKEPKAPKAKKADKPADPLA